MDHDVIVIGSGQAGVPLAARLVGEGKRVLIAERAELGGTCVNVGCTPTKTMVASARAAHVARGAGRLGVRTGAVSVDLGAVVDRKDKVVQQWRSGVEKRLAKAGERLTLARGHARFVGPGAVEVAGEVHKAPVVVVNVGGRPAAPPLPGLDGVRWLDNRTVMELREAPSHLLVIGGGYIGCEFAQMFRRFGSPVTVVDVAPRLLAQEDADVSDTIAEVFRKEGLELRLGVKPKSVESTSDGIALHLEDGTSIAASHLLVATGRRPNTDDLGCDAAGITLDKRGFIEVDDTYRTSADGVYAVGDVTPGPQFTHASWDDHRILAGILSGKGTRRRSDRLVPITAFTDPQIARVGLTEDQARAEKADFETASMPFGHVARAIEVDETAGLLKVLIDPRSERLLGAAIVGVEAGELIHVFATAMVGGLTARTLVDAEYVHPTFSEGLQSVLMRLPRYAS